jgi:hypothetical protein
MMEDGVVSKRSRGDGPRNLPSLLAVLWIIRRFKKRGDPDRPQIVSQSRQSKAVLERARQLAGEGREDAPAVTELRALARSRRKTLRQAERASRFLGYHQERRQANLTNRLLKAAVARAHTPTALTAGEEEHIAAIEAFKALSRTAQWAFLVEAEPALHNLETDVRGGRFGEVTRPPDGLLRRGTRTHETVDGERMVKVTLSSPDPPYTPEESRLLNELTRAHTLLTNELESLVGPRSRQLDPVLASQQALDTAERHLRRPPAKEAANSETPLT